MLGWSQNNTIVYFLRGVQDVLQDFGFHCKVDSSYSSTEKKVLHVLENSLVGDPFHLKSPVMKNVIFQQMRTPFPWFDGYN
jgi:hypothetical protein